MMDAKDDHQKRRLTCREEIALAIAALEAEGFADIDLLVEMLKSCNVDLDEYNAATRRAA